jgi:general nucleoside transport system permease protein
MRFRRYLPLAVVAVILVISYAFYGANNLKTEAVLSATLRFSVPLILAALCGLMGERSGVVNIGIEGQLLASAFTGFMVASSVGVWVGVLAAILTGMAIGAFLALCAVGWRMDQIIAGTVITIMATGLTSFYYRQGRTIKGSIPTWEIPLLHKIPLLGKVLFTNPPLTLASIVLVFVVHVMLFHTRWGLRTRAIGEHPSAADTVGVNVIAMRYLNVTLAGGLAGLGGAFLSLQSASTFERGMSASKGFLALALMIMGRWKPILAWSAALFFGLTSAVANQLEFDKAIDIPTQFVTMLPYVLTIVALAVFAGKVRAPAASGTPYTKE